MSSRNLEEIISRRRSHRDFNDRQITFPLLRRLLWASHGVTSEDGKRATPSAHALYPLSLRVIAAKIEGLETGLHAVSRDCTRLTHLVRRNIRLELQAAALEDQPWIASAAAIITICADFAAACEAFADQPPYGMRGTRYVHIEAGAAAQNLQLMATAEGLGCVLVAGFADEATAGVLELSAPVAPVLHLCLGWPTPA